MQRAKKETKRRKQAQRRLKAQALLDHRMLVDQTSSTDPIASTSHTAASSWLLQNTASPSAGPSSDASGCQQSGDSSSSTHTPAAATVSASSVMTCRSAGQVSRALPASMPSGCEQIPMQASDPSHKAQAHAPAEGFSSRPRPRNLRCNQAAEKARKALQPQQEKGTASAGSGAQPGMELPVGRLPARQAKEINGNGSTREQVNKTRPEVL